MNRLLLLASLTCFGVVTLGHTAEPTAREAGREALRQRPSFPWYDAEQDSLQPIELREERTTTRDFEGVSFPVTPLAFAAWAVFVLLLAGLVALIVWAWRNMPEAAPPADPRSIGRAVDATGDLDALPVRDLRDADSLRAAAESAYRAGRYRDAMIYLFSYQLVLLDRGHLIHLARGKTNRQYLRELGGQERLRHLMSDSMARFEDAFFGGRALERLEFEACWQRLAEFQGLTAVAP